MLSRRRGPSWARFAVSLTLLLLSACASVQKPIPVSEQPKTGPIRALDTSRPSIALVLSSGSARGFAHIGVIRVLEEAGIEPDLIVGSSAGSIVAAAYAAGLNARQLTDTARTVDKSILMDFTIPDLGLPLLRGNLGFIRGERLQRFVDRVVGARPIELLPRRLAIVATNLHTGKPQVFTRGNTGLAVRASCSVPGAFAPPRIDDALVADGQITSPVPVTIARALGARLVIAVDATFPPEHAELSNTLSVLFQSFTIATQRIKEHELELANLVIRPRIKTSGQLGFNDREWLIRAGEEAARENLPALRRLIATVQSELKIRRHDAQFTEHR